MGIAVTIYSTVCSTVCKAKHVCQSSNIYDICSKVFKHFCQLTYFLTLPNFLWAVAIQFILIPIFKFNVREEIVNFVDILTAHYLWEFLVCLVYYVPPAIVIYIFAKKFDVQFSKWEQWMMLTLLAILVGRPIMSLYLTSLYPNFVKNTLYEFMIYKFALMFSVVLRTWYLIYTFSPKQVRFKNVWPHLFDICDGMVMVTFQIHAENPLWVNILICVAVIPFFIVAYSNLHLCIFPEFQKIAVTKQVKSAQFVFFCVFLVVRLVLLLKLHSITDLIFTARMLERFYDDVLPEFWKTMYPHCYFASGESTMKSVPRNDYGSIHVPQLCNCTTV